MEALLAHFRRDPIPIVVELGGGAWEFWGDDGSYRWFRGGSQVHIVDTALLALDAWAHERLAAGDALDDLCRRVARGNECNAVLGICAGLCLADMNAAMGSTVAFALVTHPALWTWDISRQVFDMQSPLNEMGYWGGSVFHAQALRTLNRLPHRQHTVRDLSIYFTTIVPEQTRTAYAAAISTFLDRVPYGTAEERDDPDRAKARRDSFNALRQQADPENLVRGEQDGRPYITIRPPYVDSEGHKAILDEHASLDRVLRLHLWARGAIETGVLGDKFGLAEAFAEMAALDEPGLFDAIAPISDMTRHSAQSAVSATAAVVARHANAELWSAASSQVIDVVRRASTMIEVEDELSSRHSRVMAHPPAMAAYGYAALIRREPTNAEWRTGLLQLAIDPIDVVVEAVHTAATVFADVAPDMVWQLFCLTTDRAAGTHETGRGLHWTEGEAREQSELVERIERDVAAGLLPRPRSAPLSPAYVLTAGIIVPISTPMRCDCHSNRCLIPRPEAG